MTNYERFLEAHAKRIRSALHFHQLADDLKALGATPVQCNIYVAGAAIEEGNAERIARDIERMRMKALENFVNG